MGNTTMFKLRKVILRKKRPLECKAFCTAVQADLADALQKYFNVSLSSSGTPKYWTKKTTVQPYEIEQNCKKLQGYKIEVLPLYSLQRCVLYKPHSLEHRICLLHEIGVKKVTALNIVSLQAYMKKDMTKFKDTVEIPISENVAENILSSIGCSMADLPELSNSRADVSLEYIYQTCMSYHLSKNLGLPTEIIRSKRLFNSRSKFYSFRMLKETLGILTNVIGLDVLRYPEALLAAPCDIYSLLKCLKELRPAGFSPEEIIRRQPQFLFLTPDNLTYSINVLRTNGICEDKILENVRLFKFADKHTLIHRVETLKKIPEIWIYKGHPLFLKVLVNIRTCLTKFEYLKTSRDGEIPVHILTKPMWYLQRHQFSRYLKCQVIKNIRVVLNEEFGEYTEEAVAKILQHPNFQHVRSLTIYETAKYLKQLFSTETIACNAQVLLYNRTVLGKALNIVRTEYTAANGYDFSTDHDLKLAQYLLEKSIGFSGDSVWYTEFPVDEYVPHLPPDFR